MSPVISGRKQARDTDDNRRGKSFFHFILGAERAIHCIPQEGQRESDKDTAGKAAQADLNPLRA